MCFRCKYTLVVDVNMNLECSKCIDETKLQVKVISYNNAHKFCKCGKQRYACCTDLDGFNKYMLCDLCYPKESKPYCGRYCKETYQIANDFS